MSSDLPNDARSSRTEAPADADVGLADQLRLRGRPLIEALEQHLPGSRDHAEATASYAFAAAVGLGFDRSQCEAAREAATLHDVGLIYVETSIAGKHESERDAGEQVAWDAHYEAGYRLARGAGIPEHVCGWLLRTRERYDGRGPERLARERIPLEARLIRAACACQTALVEPIGEEASPIPQAIERLESRAGADLDPRVVDALTAILRSADLR